MKNKFIESPLVRGLLFLYIFVSVFFPLGFYTLLVGPSKWVVEAALKNTWSEHKEEMLQKLVILILIIVSIILSGFLWKIILSKKSVILRYGIFSFLTVIFLLSNYIYTFNPEAFIKFSSKSQITTSQSHINDSGKQIEFVLGAYPDLMELKRLKASGYTGIVSLLNEMVVPAEPNLIREEEENAKKVGIKLIQIPMLPWVSGNNKSIDKIHNLAKKGQGIYYVHCYLGRDRVNVFRKIVKDMGVNSKLLQAEFLRHIEDLPRFERGTYTKLGNGIYLTPFPTEEEFFGYIVNGQFATVVSLLDPTSAEDTVWISKEKYILSKYGVKYINLPISNDRDLKGLKILIDSFPKIKKPLVIHKYSSSDPLYKILIQKLSNIIK